METSGVPNSQRFKRIPQFALLLYKRYGRVLPIQDMTVQSLALSRSLLFAVLPLSSLSRS